VTIPTKPLGRKSYGSIGHLPGSRRGPGDHGCNPGHAKILTETARDAGDHIIVQEKLDGSNVGVCKVGGKVIPLNRAGYVATTSPYEQHQLFAEWVRREYARFDPLLDEGESIAGEWLAQAHGTRYDLTGREPFVVFDLFRKGGTRLHYDALCCRNDFNGLLSDLKPFTLARVIHRGGPISIERVVELLEPSGHGALDPVEGAVWRCERDSKVEFLAKYVRPGKVDGCYLPGENDRKFAPVWNWRP